MRGFISCIKHGGQSGNAYTISGTDGVFKSVAFNNNLVLSLGDIAKINGKITVEDKDSSFEKKVHSALKEFIADNTRKDPYKKSIKQIDAVTEKLWPNLLAASSLFLRRLMLGAPIFVRFHNDADGSSGAYSLYLAIKDLSKKATFAHNIIWIMNKGVSYTRQDAENDILLSNNYESVEKPLLMIIDFGTTTDSNSGIDAISGKFDIIWLDHHPVMEDFDGKKLDHYVNPWLHDGDSNYTAGFLASAFAKTFSNLNTSEIENASFIGDYSEYADIDGKGSDVSTIFDLLTSDLGIAFGPNKSNVTPQEFESILNNKEKFSELLAYANVQLSETIDKGMKALKQYKGKNFKIFLLDFEDVRSDDTKYPLPGRFSSKLLGEVRKTDGENIMVIVHVGAYLLMRLDKTLSKELSLLDVIANVKDKYGSYIEGGGGHRAAATIKLRDKRDKKGVIRFIIDSLK